MDHVLHGQATPTTHTIVSQPDGLSIRKWKHSDAPSIAHHANNKKIWDNLRNRMPHPYTQANAEWWIDFCLDTANHVGSGNWKPESGAEGPAVATNFAVTLNDEAIGSIGLDFKDPADIYVRTAELGYWIGEEHWGKGIMSRLLPPFIEWAWETFGILVRISSETYESNAASGKVLEKAGFKFEGRRPDMVFKNGVVGAELMWGVLRPR